MKTKYSILAIVALLAFTACEKTINIESDLNGTTIVIDGLITNEAGRQYVKITRTAGFYESGATPRVTDALVSVKDDLGNTATFHHNPTGQPATDGYYFPAGNFKGEIGRTYTLTVFDGADMYEAQDALYRVTDIDSLSYRINEDEQDNPKTPGKFYELLAFMKEPQETKDYYLFKFYRNDSVTYYLRNSDIYFANDDGIGENIDGIPSPVYYAINDKATMEIYSLSRNAFLYYNDLSNLLNNDGGMISPPPVNPRTNLSNGALGFFRASAVHSTSITIQP